MKAEVACMLAAAEAADVQEDETSGKDKRGDEMPDWASDKEKRLAKTNWCPWSRQLRTISAASQSRPQRTLARPVSSSASILHPRLFASFGLR
jgi:hypothetical protein